MARKSGTDAFEALAGVHDPSRRRAAGPPLPSPSGRGAGGEGRLVLIVPRLHERPILAWHVWDGPWGLRGDSSESPLTPALSRRERESEASRPTKVPGTFSTSWNLVYLYRNYGSLRGSVLFIDGSYPHMSQMDTGKERRQSV